MLTQRLRSEGRARIKSELKQNSSTFKRARRWTKQWVTLNNTTMSILKWVPATSDSQKTDESDQKAEAQLSLDTANVRSETPISMASSVDNQSVYDQELNNAGSCTSRRTDTEDEMTRDSMRSNTSTDWPLNRMVSNQLSEDFFDTEESRNAADLSSNDEDEDIAEE
ncbi:hypothetical protein GJ496_010279 [Pomphorhynchus laevis]|nr:hypothetical protein GJ496_010279 [Pomphorhynchus laevis]